MEELTDSDYRAIRLALQAQHRALQRARQDMHRAGIVVIEADDQIHEKLNDLVQTLIKIENKINN